MKTKTYDQAIPLLLKMKNKDHLRLAYAFETGLEDFQQAELFYQKAVEETIPNANYFLACLYQSQENKFRKAEGHFQAAVQQGNAEAAFALGTLYLGKKRFKAAKDRFNEAVELGNFDAKLMLIFMDISITKK